MKIFVIICLILVILAILSLIIGVYLSNYDKENSDAAFGAFIGLVLSVFVIFLVVIMTNPIPPIEVYRGNTDLQITYQDSVPIDSVVVYKNK